MALCFLLYGNLQSGRLIEEVRRTSLVATFGRSCCALNCFVLTRDIFEIALILSAEGGVCFV